MATLTEQEVRSLLATLFERCAPLLGGHRVLLFGSRARGDARPLSDFDVGVVGPEPLDLMSFYEIEDRIEALPTLQRIDWVDLNRASETLRLEALRDGEVLFGA